MKISYASMKSKATSSIFSIKPSSHSFGKLMFNENYFMRQTRKITMLVIILSIGSTFGNTGFYRYIRPAISTIEQDVVLVKPKIEVEAKEIKVPNQMKNFLAMVGRRESSNRWTVVNKWGYMGRYQMSRKNVDKFLGKHITNKQFINSRDLQNQCMLMLLRHNKKTLRRQIAKYSNSAVHGVYVTESGILAAAHLAGAGNVRRWFRNGKNPKDKLGTALTDYMQLFSGYNLDISI